MKKALSLLPAVTAFCFAMSLLASSAQAGLVTIVQGHPLKLKGTALAQDVKDNGDLTLDKGRFTEKLIGAICRNQEKLEKNQAVIVTLNDACGDPNDNAIQIVQTDPFVVLDTIGDISFDVGFALQTEKNGTLKTLTVPAEVELSCLGLFEIDIAAEGNATVTYDSDGLCVQTVKLKNATGTGTVDGQPVVLDKTNADAKKPQVLLVSGP